MQVGPVETTGPRPVTSMRIVIRGARGAGKTSMLQRLRGQRWGDKYVPTPEIATAQINWTYKTRDDIVKVRAHIVQARHELNTCTAVLTVARL